MFKFISKLILVFTVLSALVGQAMAVDTMSFEMDIDNKHYNRKVIFFVFYGR